MYLTKEEIAEKYPNAIIHESAMIHEGAIIRKGAIIYEGAVIHKGAVICEGAIIHKGAVIGVGRKEVINVLVVLGIGETKNITAYVCSEGLRINIGCMNNYKGYSLKKTKEEIAKKYESDHEYFIALMMIERWYERINQTQTS